MLGFPTAATLSAAAFAAATAAANASWIHQHPPALPRAPRVQITALDRWRALLGGWQRVNAPPPFGPSGAGTALLLTDGSVIVQDDIARWYRLVPDQFGSYVNGTWSSAGILPHGYTPYYFSSAVLADGRLILSGGENNGKHSETSLGALYDPRSNEWTRFPGPSWFPRIGDATNAVLADGTYMLDSCCNKQQVLLDVQQMLWRPTGSGKADGNSEEGWTLLPDGTVLCVDVGLHGSTGNSERYTRATNSWSFAGTIPVDLIGSAYEIGPQVLRPNGTVFVPGSTGHTAVYSSGSGSWTAGPDLPVVGSQQLVVEDGPGTLLRNGDVLFAASLGNFMPPASFFEFDGVRFLSVPGPPNAPNDASFILRLLMLPTGQVLETDHTDDVEIFTPRAKELRSIAPTIASVPGSLTPGQTYTVTGKRFNGFSQANMYGDDATMASNYPLVRITNATTSHVFYARTHDHSSMAVASQAMVSTHFDVPTNIELGAASLEVVANGIASRAVSVTIN